MIIEKIYSNFYLRNTGDKVAEGVKKNSQIHIYFHFVRTFVGIFRNVDSITFWKIIVTFSSVITLNNFPNNIELSAIS